MFETIRIQTQLAAIVKIISCELDRVKDTLHFLASNTLHLFQTTRNEAEAISTWLEKDAFAVGEDGFYLSLPQLQAFRNGTLSNNTLSYSWPPDKISNPDARFRLYCHRTMGQMLKGLLQRLPGAVCVYYQDVTNTALQYPYIDQITAITPDFDWSQYHTFVSVKPESNPQRDVRWSPPHIDYAGQGLIIVASIPVYYLGEFIGLWSIDIQVEHLIRNDILTPTQKTQLTCVVQKNGALVCSSNNFLLDNLTKGDVPIVKFNDTHKAFSKIELDTLFESNDGHLLIELDKNDFQIYWERIHCMDWLCITAFSSRESLSSAKKFFKNAFNSLGEGEDEATIDIATLPDDMLELGESYNNMVAKLNNARKKILHHQAELAHEKALAETANHAKSIFLANMSHELRTPLNGIMAMQQLLQSSPLNTEQQEYITMAMQSARRLTSLLGDILDLTKIETGNMSIAQRPMVLAESFEVIKQLFDPSCQQKGIELRFHIEETIPHILSGDPIRLQQIINNLVGNAVKFTDKGTILCEAYPLPSNAPATYRVLFSVSDTGIGIEDQNIVRLFEAFTQGDEGYKRSFQGAGLGLSIVRQLVALMGGNISVASDPGTGTTIFFCLPFGIDANQTEDIPSAPAQMNNSPRPYSILLAEDDTVNRLAVKKILENAGYRVTAVENGAEALKELSANEYALVLMDIQMPVMDGVLAIKAIRAGEAGKKRVAIPIIALTAYAMAGDVEIFLEAGANDYLAKPVEIDQLTTKMVNLLSC